MDASLLSSFTSTFELMLLNVWVLSLIHLSKITHTWVNLHHPESTNYSTFLLQVTHHNGSLWMQRFTHYFEFNLLGFFCCVRLRRVCTAFLQFLGLLSFESLNQNPNMVSKWAFIHIKTGSVMLFMVSATFCHNALRWTDFFFAMNRFTKIISRQKKGSCSSVQFIILQTEISGTFLI